MQLSSAPKGRIGATNKKVDNSQARYASDILQLTQWRSSFGLAPINYACQLFRSSPFLN